MLELIDCHGEPAEWPEEFRPALERLRWGDCVSKSALIMVGIWRLPGRFDGPKARCPAPEVCSAKPWPCRHQINRTGIGARDKKGKTGQKGRANEQQRATDGRILVSFLSCSEHPQTALSVILQGVTAGSQKMGWVGLEPTTNALKGRCSTIELPTQGKRSATVSLKRIVASGFEGGFWRSKLREEVGQA